MTISLDTLAKQLGLTYRGNPSLALTHCCAVTNIEKGGVAFISDRIKQPDIPKLARFIKGDPLNPDWEKISYSDWAVIIPNTEEIPANIKGNFIISPDPLVSHLAAIKLLHPDIKRTGLISPDATVSKKTHIGNNVTIEAGARIEDNVTIGDNTLICSNAVIMDGSQLGTNVTIDPSVTLYHNTVIGDFSIIRANSVIGGEGFGLYVRGDNLQDIPQIGNVVIGKHVTIGMLNNISCARFDSTVIGDYTKTDSFVHIAHNTVIGKNCILGSACGIAGSCRFGDRIVIGAYSMFADHIVVASDVSFIAGSIISGSVTEEGVYGGQALQKFSSYQKTLIIMRDLPKVIKKLQVSINALQTGIKK